MKNLTEATAERNPLRGHIVGFPKAIPSRDWLAQRMLWADHLGSVWPVDEPTPQSDEEQLALQDTHTYEAAGFFTPCSMPWDSSPEVLKQLRASLKLSDNAAGRWLRKWATKAYDQLDPEAVADKPLDPNQYFYVNKFPDEVQRVLRESGVAKREGDWIAIRSVRSAEALMAALAEHVEPAGEIGLPRILETEDLAALARAAAPTSASDSRPAGILDVPLIRGVVNGVKAERLVEFRQKPKTERARQDYLDAVAQYVARQVSGDPSKSAAVVAQQRIAEDLKLASKTWGKRAAEAGLGSVVLSTVSTLVPLSPESAGEWVGLTAGAAGAGFGLVTAVRKSHVHGYLNSARRAELLG